MKRTQNLPLNRLILLWAALTIALMTAFALPTGIGGALGDTAAPAAATAPIIANPFSYQLLELQRGGASRLHFDSHASPVKAEGLTSLASVRAAQVLLLDTDLGITKTATLEPAIAGSPLGYMLTIRNQGALTATGVTLTDTLPLSATHTASSPACTYVELSHLVTCSLASLSMDASALFTITVDLDPAARGELVNKALVTHDSVDPDPFNDTDILTTTIQADADLALAKTDFPDPATAGEALLYTLTVTNNGPSDLTSAVLTDTLPAGVTFDSASLGCGPVGGDVVCTLSSLPSGGVLPVTMTVFVDPGTTGVLENTAVVVGAEMDSDNANNSTGPVTTTVLTSADLLLSKSDSPDPVTAGELLTYTLTITNTGPSDALDVALTDTLPTMVTFISVIPSPACTHTAGVVSCSLGTLAVNDVTVVTLVVQVEPDSTGAILNDAIATSSTPDPDGTGPTASASTAVEFSGDLALTIQDDPDPVVAGAGQLTYTLTLINNGPSLAQNISVADTLPTDVSYINSTTTQGTCSHTSGTVLCSLGDLNATNTATIVIFVSVAPDAAGTLVNTAVANATTPDPVSANNTAIETTQISAFADLGLAKTGTPDPVVAGGVLTYTLTISNAGPSGAVGTILTDTLPGETTFLTALPPQGSCGEISGVVVCDLGTLGFNTTIEVPIIVTVDPGAVGSTLSNQAEVASSAVDVVAGNNTASLNTTVIASADLQIQKLDTPDALPPGEVLTYTVVVENNGPSNAADVVMTDTLPVEVTLLNITPDPGGSCSGITVIVCDYPALAAGDTASVQIVVLVDPIAPTGSIFNSTSVSSLTPDPDLSNNTFVEETILANQIVDLLITKADEPDPVKPDEVLTYTLEVSNSGPSLASSVVMTDTLPTGVTFLQASASQGSCTQTDPVVCTLGDVPTGPPVQITILVTVEPGTVGLITNSAVVASVEPDSNIDNNLIQEGTTVTPEADLMLAKADGPDPVYVSPDTGLSYPLVYTLTVTNLGPSTALSVTLTDNLPAEVTFQSATPGAPTCTALAGVVTCDLGSVPAGGRSDVSIITTVDPMTPISTTLLNQASVTATTADPSPADNAATASTLVISDDEPPQVTWTLPVSEGLRLDVGNQFVRLKVNPTDNNGIARVRFKRWDLDLLQWVYLGTVTSPPYEIDFETSGLFYEWNEVRAETYDLAENSIEPRIWLYRLYTSHLPVIRR